MPKKSLAYNRCANRLASVFSFTPGVKLSRAGRPSWVTRSRETSAALRKANGKGGKKGNFNHRRFHVRRHGVPIQPQPSKTEAHSHEKSARHRFSYEITHAKASRCSFQTQQSCPQEESQIQRVVVDKAA